MSSKEETPKIIPLSRSYRIILFTIIVSVELAISASSGILSLSSKAIKAQFKMNDKKFGMFGTMNGIGRSFGSFLYILISNKTNPKWMFIFFCTIKGLMCIMFKFSNNALILIILRGIIGITHMPVSIYIPVWIDQFGLKNYKTVQLTFRQVVIPVGKVTGYALSVFYGEENFQLGFVTEGCYLLFVAFFVLLSPQNYFSKYVVLDKENENEKKSIFKLRSSKELKEKSKISVFQNICSIFTNKKFNIINLTRSIMHGVNTAIHYWCADYMRSVIGVNDSKIIFISYTIVCVLGPFGAVFINSFISSFLKGGYDKPNAPKILFNLHIISSIFGLIIPFVRNLYSFCIVLMLFLIFDASDLTFVNGLIMNSVSSDLKGSAFSITNMFSMLVTSGPAPLIYGAVNDHFKPLGYYHYGMLFLMICNSLVLIMMGIFICVSNNENKKDKLIDEQGQEMEEEK